MQQGGEVGRAEAARREQAFSYSRGALLLARAELAPDREALGLTTRALDLARAHGHADPITAAPCARAEVRLALGEVAPAHEDSAASAARWPEQAPRDDRVRPLLVHRRVLSALGDPNADVPLRQALAWLGRAVRNVPPEFRAAFPEDHATRRALRALAQVRLSGETAP
ncbi:hypothetical protein DAERI_100129 [Deinococcus aerius]|uniref:Uncharacterized protein n=1 Tax=Deinococcus aerius TaxID=200253 RepID=A0A2I9D7L9_9DEIO|nr:hypothetical protein [Deinococcus aerius]GBF06766.1 hypothetical protein DAERI_100129 [Deinococcus aerius]